MLVKAGNEDGNGKWVCEGGGGGAAASEKMTKWVCEMVETKWKDDLVMKMVTVESTLFVFFPVSPPPGFNQIYIKIAFACHHSLTSYSAEQNM